MARSSFSGITASSPVLHRGVGIMGAARPSLADDRRLRRAARCRYDDHRIFRCCSTPAIARIVSALPAATVRATCRYSPGSLVASRNRRSRSGGWRHTSSDEGAMSTSRFRGECGAAALFGERAAASRDRRIVTRRDARDDLHSAGAGFRHMDLLNADSQSRAVLDVADPVGRAPVLAMARLADQRRLFRPRRPEPGVAMWPEFASRRK